MDTVQSMFCQLLKDKGLECSEDKLVKFDKYYQILILWNEKMNLTGITDREQVYLKHFYDSVSLAFFIPVSSVVNLADIGSGAGFPSIPLKIMFPHLKVTIIDSLNKRIQFLNHLILQLGLEGVDCLHARAEDAARSFKHRDKYDMVTARAVAKLNVLNELCLPFVVKGGSFVAMKGTDPTDEIKEASYSIRQLKSRINVTHNFELPIEQSNRHIIVIDKLQSTPAKYPRKAGLPLKFPLF